MKTKNLIKQNQQTWLKKHEEELIRAELNLCKLLSLWSTSKSKKRSKIIEQKEILPDGSIRTKRISIGKIGENEAGIFTIKKHFKTILALFKISAEQNNPEVCKFGIHQLAEILGLEWSGRTYNYLKDAILDLEGIPITFENIFYNKETEETEELIARFRWLEDLKIYGRLKNKQPTLSLSTFKLNQYIRQSILKGYTKPLFLTIVTSLKTEIAILLYNHLDLVMADKDYYERTLKNLIEVDFRLDGKYRYAGDRKILFNKPIKELKGIKLTTGILNDIKLEKTKNGKDYKIVCRKYLPVIEVGETQGIKQLPFQETTKAMELILYFHTKLDPKKKKHRPTAKELQQAKELLEQYGEEKTKYIIDYALKQAKETKFEMKYFGAVFINYTQDALDCLQKEEEYKKQKEELERKNEAEDKLQEEYYSYRENILEDFKSGLKTDELKLLQKEAEEYYCQTQSKMKEWKQAGNIFFQRTIEANFNKWLIKQGKVKILDFESWKAGRG